MFSSRRNRCLPLLFLLALFLIPVTASATDRLGIILESKTDPDQDQQVLNAATTAFLESRHFHVIERTRMDSILEEHDFQEFTGSAIQELARLVGLDYLALVSYTTSRVRQTDSFRITARVIEVTTGQIRATVDSGATGFGLLGALSIPSAGERLMESVKEYFPIRGHVIKVEGREVVVDLGTANGLKEGDLLDVLQQGEDIVHPVYNTTVPGEERVVGTLKVTNLTPTTALCKLKKKGEANPGDMVEYRKSRLGAILP